MKRPQASLPPNAIARAALLGMAFLFAAAPAFGQGAATDAGRQAWSMAGCAGCHGERGQGGVNPDFPHGPSLRTTELDRDLLIEAISCGRPGTQMPAWLKGAYTQQPCFGGPAGPPPPDTTVTGILDAGQVEALADYILKTFVQK